MSQNLENVLVMLGLVITGLLGSLVILVLAIASKVVSESKAQDR